MQFIHGTFRCLLRLLFFFSAALKTSRTSVQSQFCFCFSPLEFSSAYESDSSAKLSLLSVLFEIVYRDDVVNRLPVNRNH